MVVTPPAGTMGTSPNPNGPKSGLPASTPRSSDQSASEQSKRKQAALLDKKALELEDEFKAKHFGVMGVLAWILLLHVAGIYLFTKGFLLTRMVLENKSSCDVLPFEDILAQPHTNLGSKQQKGCWHEKTFDKAVVIIIDALRYDFTVPFASKGESDTVHLFHNNIPVFYETAVQNPANAFLLPFIADPPTTTLNRLKGLTTGTLPTFLDAGSNFAGTAIDEDNLVAQLHSAGKNLVHLGDDTWQALFPGYFDPNLTHAYDSFNVWDLHTVDNGVNEHLFPLLRPENSKKWDVIFGHYLGVDHAGHRYGPNHAAMASKLQEMDRVIRDIIAALDDKTLLVVMGDHGMDIKGDHGGESDDEVEAALWMYSKRGIFGRTSKDTLLPPQLARDRFVPQIDLVPTLSLLLGMPIPFNNLGSPIEEVFSGPRGNNWANLATVNRLTAAQVKRYQHEYAVARGAGDDEESDLLWTAAEEEWKSASKGFSSKSTAARASNELYRKYQRRTLDICRGLWARFDVPSMIQGVGILFASIILLIIYARGLKTDRTQLTSRLLQFASMGAGVGAVAGSALGLTGLTEMSMIDGTVLFAAAGSILGATPALVKKPANLSLPLPNGMWGWLALFFTVSQSVGFASNSYTIWEDEILLFFLTTFGVCAGISSMRQKQTTDRILGVYHSILFVILGRIASFSRLCREEQMPFCRSTYYASSTSSTSAPWQLAIPFLVTLFLPSVVRSFYAGSKSYEGAASLWIGFAFRFGLFTTSLFWILEAADDGEWLPVSNETLKFVRVFLAQFVLALALVAGTAAYFYSKPCVSINKKRKKGSKIMNPHISVPRQHAGPANFGSTPATQSSVRMPRFFKRLFKFPQMDFEMAIWEMTSLLIAPKKVFKSIYYHKQTKNTWHRPDPSFTYLLSFFLVLTAFAWGLAYRPGFGAIIRLTFLFVFVHFIGSSLLVSTIGYFIIGRLFGPNGAAASLAGLRGSRGRRRGAAQGLFTQPGEKEQLEFGYCFDVSNRAFFPLYLHLYVVQFLLLPLLTRSPSDFLATFLGNSLYLSALIYYTYITFLGYNALPFLHNTELLLVPILIFAVMWLVSLIAGWGIVMQGHSVKGLFWGV